MALRLRRQPSSLDLEAELSNIDAEIQAAAEALDMDRLRELEARRKELPLEIAHAEIRELEEEKRSLEAERPSAARRNGGSTDRIAKAQERVKRLERELETARRDADAALMKSRQDRFYSENRGRRIKELEARIQERRNNLGAIAMGPERPAVSAPKVPAPPMVVRRMGSQVTELSPEDMLPGAEADLARAEEALRESAEEVTRLFADERAVREEYEKSVPPQKADAKGLFDAVNRELARARKNQENKQRAVAEAAQRIKDLRKRIGGA